MRFLFLAACNWLLLPAVSTHIVLAESPRNSQSSKSSSVSTRTAGTTRKWKEWLLSPWQEGVSHGLIPKPQLPPRRVSDTSLTSFQAVQSDSPSVTQTLKPMTIYGKGINLAISESKTYFIASSQILYIVRIPFAFEDLVNDWSFYFLRNR